MNLLSIESAINALQQGQLVAFPTETVYGLGTDATNLEAIANLYHVKQRPLNHPLIVHVASVTALEKIAINLPPELEKLATAFWPGPLTVLLQKHPELSNTITGGQETVAVRIPNHPVALELLSRFNKPLVAPSANKFGRISPTCAADVVAEFGSEIAGVIDGGQCEVGIESTILDLTHHKAPKILRPGMINIEQLQPYFSEAIIQANNDNNSPQVSGSFPSHYAPTKPTFMIRPEQLQLLNTNKEIALLAFNNTTPQVYAHDLYKTLRQWDNDDVIKQIIIETPPDNFAWHGIQDRIKKASANTWFEI